MQFFIVPIPFRKSDPVSRSEDALEGLFLRLLSYLLFLHSSNNIMAVGSGWESDKVFCQNPLVCRLSAFKNFSKQVRKSFFKA